METTVIRRVRMAACLTLVMSALWAMPILADEAILEADGNFACGQNHWILWASSISQSAAHNNCTTYVPCGDACTAVGCPNIQNPTANGTNCATSDPVSPWPYVEIGKCDCTKKPDPEG